MTLEEIARRSVGLIDLTSLGDNDTAQQIDTLCDRALQFNVAAVCVWPDFVAQCHKQLQGFSIHLATVVNFPDGGTDIHAAVQLTEQCLGDGADEIDLVMPYTAWMHGDVETARGMIQEVKKACGSNHLKVILETGSLKTGSNIQAASELAIDAGADFLKTSTGKIPVSATPGAATVMLSTIQRSGKDIGFKAAGGIRTLRQAGNYLRIADQVFGPDWVTPSRFRFGASTLLDACLPYLEPNP